MDDRDAAGLLHEVCASRAWGAAVAAWAAVRHGRGAARRRRRGHGRADRRRPRRGDGRTSAHRAASTPGDAASAREQSGVRDAERAELLELNLAYQERHGHVFLICATGRTGEEMLAALRERIHHDADTEREIVRTELGKINRIRLTRLTETLQAPRAPAEGER